MCAPRKYLPQQDSNPVLHIYIVYKIVENICQFLRWIYTSPKGIPILNFKLDRNYKETYIYFIPWFY